MMIGGTARNRIVSSKLIPPRNWFLKRSISPPIPFSRSPPTTNRSGNRFYESLRDVNIIELFRLQTGDSIVKLQGCSSKMENDDKHKPIFYVHRESRTGYSLLTPVSVEDDGSLSYIYSISLPIKTLLNPGVHYSCNGLFCYGDRTCDEHELFVWNPTTMETRKLPISPHTFEPPDDPHCIYNYNEVTVPFDNLTKVNEFVATWADPQSEDYKLLRYYTFHDYNGDGCDYPSEHFCPTQLELYSLKTDSWKKLCWEEAPDYRNSCCYIDGFIYMLPNNVDYRSVILSFDFRTETFSTLPFPGGCHRSSYKLLNCNGQLSLLRFRCNYPYVVEMEHWVMSNGEWAFLSRYPDVCGVLGPLGFARNGKLLLFESVDHWEPEFHLSLMVFDSAKKMIKPLPGLASRCNMSLLNFAETFVKLKPLGEQEKEDGRAIQEQVIA